MKQGLIRYVCTVCLAMASGGYGSTLWQVTQQAWRFDPELKQKQWTNAGDAQVVGLARAPLLPQVNATAGIASHQHSGEINARDQQVGLSLSQSVIDLSALNTWRGSKHTATAMQFQTKTDQQAMLVRVGQQYFKVALDQQQLLIDREKLQSEKQLVHISGVMYRAGRGMLSDVTTAKTAYAQTKAALVGDQSVLSSDRAVLDAYTGRVWSWLAMLHTGFPLMNPKPASMPIWVQFASIHNPAILAAKQGVLVKQSHLKADYFQHFPTVDAYVNYNHGYSHNALGVNGLDQVGDQTDVGLRLNLPIFTGGKTFTQTHQDRDYYAASLAGRQLADQTVLASVKTNYQGIVQSTQQIHDLRESVALARDSYRIAVKAYKGGKLDMQQVIQNQQALYTQKQALWQASYGYLNQIILLKQAAGFLSMKDMASLSRWL